MYVEEAAGPEEVERARMELEKTLNRITDEADSFFERRVHAQASPGKTG